jgi:transposase
MLKARSKVELYERIRKVRAREPDVSVRELARRFRVHRRDVRAALISAVPPPRKAGPPRPAPKLDPLKPIIEAWLEADKDAPRKQRHTARRIWERLVDEHGAEIAEPTVRRYVAEVKARTARPLVEVAVPQHHPLGVDAEVDFGDIAVYLAGVLTTVHLFVMRLSASGQALRYAYLNQAQEVFLDGHVRAFEFFGGVPAVIRYDNLKAAVARVMRGRTREESERFTLLRSHYGFESFYCRPGIEGAHEKGGVEGEIGRFRRRWLVPVPHVASMAELNELLAEASERDSKRHIDQRRQTVAEHFAVEAEFLAALPAERFDASLLLTARVDAKSRSIRSRSASLVAASRSVSALTPSRSSTATRSWRRIPAPLPRASSPSRWITISRSSRSSRARCRTPPRWRGPVPAARSPRRINGSGMRRGARSATATAPAC